MMFDARTHGCWDWLLAFRARVLANGWVYLHPLWRFGSLFVQYPNVHPQAGHSHHDEKVNGRTANYVIERVEHEA